MSYPVDKIFASVLVCERVLHEHDGVNSAIRIVDVIYVPDSAGFRDDAFAVVQAYGLVVAKAVPGYHEEHLITVKLINTVGEVSAVLPRPFTADFRSKLGEEVPGGFTINIQLNLAVKRFGTCYLCVEIDGQEATRTPITLLASPADVGDDVITPTEDRRPLDPTD